MGSFISKSCIPIDDLCVSSAALLEIPQKIVLAKSLGNLPGAQGICNLNVRMISILNLIMAGTAVISREARDLSLRSR